MSAFKVGDRVRVTQKLHASFDKVGVVTGHEYGGHASIVRVRFRDDASPLPTYEDHLILADTDPRTPSDPVNHPSHYTSHPSGVECLTITRHMGFNLGSAFKYIWRADLKGNAIQDLEKAIVYLRDEINKREAANE